MSHDVVLAGRRWASGPARFTRPRRVIRAVDPGEVAAALEEAESASREGAWVAGFVSYQAAPGLDPKLAAPGEASLPLVWFGVYDRREEAGLPAPGGFLLGGWEPSLDQAAHSALVERIRDAIAEGETYQVNLTFQMVGRFQGDPERLYAAMIRAQPDSYGALVDLGPSQVVSVSPELFFVVDGSRITTRPMKGTAPRGRHSAEDEAIRARLVESEKEQAGNVMIVDMLRNDLGRVARTGSVEVAQLFHAERHPTVWQLTSTVVAELSPGVGIADVFRALFPSGSVTGAPKVSTMGLIAALESRPREVYCGAVGYLRPGGGGAEFSVAIRTGVVAGDRFTFHVGGGITYDSDAAVEYEECLWKALVVTRHREPPDLVETMRYEPGAGIPLLEEHMRRLAASADYWGIPLHLGRVGDALSAVGGPHPGRVRLVLYRDGGIEVSTGPVPLWDEPVPLLLSSVRVDPADPLWYHKTTDRSRYPESEEDVESILVNLDGEVTETDRSNLMAHLDGEWVTPPVASGLLPGVARARAIAERGVRERSLTVDDLTRADELAVTNALRGWRKATLIR